MDRAQGLSRVFLRSIDFTHHYTCWTMRAHLKFRLAFSTDLYPAFVPAALLVATPPSLPFDAGARTNTACLPISDLQTTQKGYKGTKSTSANSHMQNWRKRSRKETKIVSNWKERDANARNFCLIRVYLQLIFAKFIVVSEENVLFARHLVVSYVAIFLTIFYAYY